MHLYTQTHTHTSIYKYNYMCVSVCGGGGHEYGKKNFFVMLIGKYVVQRECVSVTSLFTHKYP
jgi:hypothetical protein